MKTLKELRQEPRITIEQVSDDGFKGSIGFPKWRGSVICSIGAGWEHVSVAPYQRRITHSWEDMCRLKDIFFREDEAVIQIHPPKSEYVNNVKNCLHLWRCTYKDMVLPPSVLVGVKDGQVNVTINKASDNIDAVYNQVGSEINSKFSHDYHTTANLHVSIHVDYSIANPTKTVTFSGAGSGSGTIHAHALGGYFDQPHYGLIAEAGGEYIIPINGSSRSIEMWREAGEMLGMNFGSGNMLEDFLARSMVGGSNPFEGGLSGTTQGTQGLPAVSRGIPAPLANAAPAGTQAPSGSNEKTININIGSNGTIRFSGGVNKDDVVEMMMDNLKDVFIRIVEQEIVEEGEGVYQY